MRGIRSGSLTAFALLACAAAGPTTAQSDWFPPGAPVNRSRHALAHLPGSGRVVMFGGDGEGWSNVGNGNIALADTWEWDGSRWIERYPERSPSNRAEHWLLPDYGANRVLLVGGRVQLFPSLNRLSYRDIWEWDGRDWRLLANPVSPAPEYGSAYAYDSGRRRLVAFGCGQGCTLGAETWEWDGATWLLRQPANAPPPRAHAAMTYDPLLRRTVLFGGNGQGAVLSDCWTWDGTRWQQIAGGPPPRARADLVFDPATGQCWLFGGELSFGAARRDVWSLQGSTWRQVVPDGTPNRRDAATAYDPTRQNLLLHGGSIEYLGSLSDTLQLGSGAFVEILPSPTPPLNPAGGALLTRPGGGLWLLPLSGIPRPVQLYERLAGAWRPIPVAGPKPLNRESGRLVHDPVRNRLVLFGGTNDSTLWEFDGTAWTNPSVAQPPSRFLQAMAYDPNRQQVLMFGGYLRGSGNYADDTWSWDGTRWTQLALATRPSPRGVTAIATDFARGRIVLFGGFANGSVPADTWEWDGSRWSERRPATTPPFHDGLAAFDARLGQVVMYNRVERELQTWAWDGTDWRDLGTTRGPDRRMSQLAFDASTNTLVGLAVGAQAGGSWDLASVRTTRVTRTFGTGCPSSTGGTPVLSAEAPYVGETGQVSLRVPGLSAAPVVYLLGTSDSSWAGGILPFALDGLGMPGCSLLVEPLIAVCIGEVLDGAGPRVALPSANPGLAGQSLFVQAIVLDPPANATGAIVSDGVELRIGLR